MKNRGFVFSTLVALAVTTTVRAETIESGGEMKPGSRILAYVVATPQLKTMFEAARRQDMALHLQSVCQGEMQIRPRGVIVAEAIDLPDDRTTPARGQWEVRYDLVRCGDTKRYSVFFAADPAGGAPKLLASFPGETLASLRLLHDAMPTTTTLANGKAGDGRCAKSEQILMADMRIDEMPHRLVEGEHVYERVWNETWTFDVCGHAIAAHMRFVRDPRDGGTDWTATFPGAAAATTPDGG